MENYFIELNKIEGEVSKKQNLSYISWANAWDMLKRKYPDASYIIYESQDGHAFWESKYGIDVKVWVTVNSLEHIVRLPVMDWANQAMKDISYEYKTKYGKKICEAATQFDINKALQRAFTKAIAMHWIGLYVYRWEDLPEESDWSNKKDKLWEKKEIQGKFDLMDYINRIKEETDENHLAVIYKEFMAEWPSQKQIDWVTKECTKRKEYLLN